MIVLPIWAKAGLACLLIVGVWAHGRSSGKEAERLKWEEKLAKAQTLRIETYESSMVKFRQQAAVDQQSLQTLGAELAALESERRRLENIKVPVVVKREVVPNAQGKCVDARLSDAFGVCVSAAVTGSPPDTTACQTYRSNDRARTIERR